MTGLDGRKDKTKKKREEKKNREIAAKIMEFLSNNHISKSIIHERFSRQRTRTFP